jgi:hypothetical protein
VGRAATALTQTGGNQRKATMLLSGPAAAVKVRCSLASNQGVPAYLMGGRRVVQGRRAGPLELRAASAHTAAPLLLPLLLLRQTVGGRLGGATSAARQLFRNPLTNQPIHKAANDTPRDAQRTEGGVGGTPGGGRSRPVKTHSVSGRPLGRSTY